MNTQNLKTLQNQALHLHMQGLYKSERELLHQVLITLQEIYFRKMYLEFHFDSLFNYLTEGTGYTKGTAHRRIQAMLLLNEVPSVGEKIKSGEINFARMNIVQKTAKDLAYRTTKKVTAKEKEQLLDLLANKEVAESQQTVAEFFDMPVRQKVEVC